MKYILPLDLQLKWIEAIKTYSCEWVAGLLLKNSKIDWFNFKLGKEHEVEFISLKRMPRAVGTVHSHTYEHSKTPIPSLSDGINWVYLSFHEISDDLNPIFFIVFKDGYASWAMFPKPPIVRSAWMDEFDKLGRDRRKEEEVSRNVCLKLLDQNLIKAGLFSLGRSDQEFLTQ